MHPAAFFSVLLLQLPLTFTHPSGPANQPLYSHYSCEPTEYPTSRDDCLAIINNLPVDGFRTDTLNVLWGHSPTPNSHLVPRYYKHGRCGLSIDFTKEAIRLGGNAYYGPTVLRAKSTLNFLAAKWCQAKGASLEIGSVRFELGAPRRSLTPSLSGDQ